MNLSGNSRGLAVTGGSVYVAFEDPRYVTSLARLSSKGEPETIGTLPGRGGARGVAVVDDWALVSVACGTCSQPASVDLAAIPVGGGAPRPVATGLHAAAASMGPGIVFVDASNRLIAMSARDVDAILTPSAAP